VDGDRDDIKAVVERITAAWSSGHFDELRPYFHPDVVQARPGFAGRTVGRDALVAGYAEFARQATIHSLTTGEIHIDQTGDSAVTTMPWTMDYEINGERYQEHGWELFVFGRHEDQWLVVWRTLVVER
jgi:ketosteroid isomerase-like protein